jgi:hypothetical protein
VFEPEFEFVPTGRMQTTDTLSLKLPAELVTSSSAYVVVTMPLNFTSL